MDVFKRSILGRLAKPAHPFEVEFDNQLTHPQYIIDCPIDSWRVFSFIDDTNVWTCRPGSGPGPVGNPHGPCRLIPSPFGGEVRSWSFPFHWFADHLFVTFFHKISGWSIEGWIGHMDVFNRLILGCLAKPAHPFEVEFDNQLAHPQYIIECPIDSWRVFGFIDDTNVWTCRHGSGPVGNPDGPGQPRRQFADLIQRAFYR
jgi:hypothetical protein